MKCASCVGTTRFQCGKDAWRLLTAWLAGTQMKSPGVQLCRGIGRGSSTLYAGTHCRVTGLIVPVWLFFR